MLAFAFVLAVAAPPPAVARSPWDDCLLAYAQTEALGTKTAVRIAGEALAACAPERQRYLKTLVRRFQPTASRDHSALDQALAVIDIDQKAAIRRVLAFIGRNRQE